MLCSWDSTWDCWLLYPRSERFHETTGNAITICDCYWCICKWATFVHPAFPSRILLCSVNRNQFIPTPTVIFVSFAGWVSLCENGVFNLRVLTFLWRNSTFIGIAVHTATTIEGQILPTDLAAGVRQDANGILGTTLQLADLVSFFL